MKKSICLIVVIFLLSLSFYGIVADESTLQKTIYVDDDNTEGPWDGSMEHPYRYIQDGIDASEDEDTVFVYSGQYGNFLSDNLACVNIDKRINLIGEDKYYTIINGPGYQRVIYIREDFVNVCGFTVKYGGSQNPQQYGIGIDVYENKKNISIYDNIVRENLYGIEIGIDTRDVHIHDNVIMDNYIGIENSASGSKINNNFVSQNENGLFLYGDRCRVFKNVILNNVVGITLLANSNILYYNQIEDNDIGINVFNSRKSIVCYNNFINNEIHGNVYKYTSLILLSTLLLYKTKWFRNYWNEWRILPKSIIGTGEIIINIFVGGGVHRITIAKYQFIQFDWHPAKEPYDIL